MTADRSSWTPTSPGRAGPDDERILSQTASEAVLDRLMGFARQPKRILPEITSWCTLELRWGRNRAALASDRRDMRVWLLPSNTAEIGHRRGWTTNQLDDLSLANLMRAREGSPKSERKGQDDVETAFVSPAPTLSMPAKSIVWSDATYGVTADRLGEIARGMIEPAEVKTLLSAGYLEVRAGSRLWTVNGQRYYQRFTQAQCSMTVRDTQGTGSGWAGNSSYDWEQLDTAAVAKLAVAKCQASQNPVALEPGRYTVILEPQAVADLLEIFVGSFSRPGPMWPEPGAEAGIGPFALYVGRTKLGLRVVDERLTLSHDPADPMLGIVPEPGEQRIEWIKDGILTNLSYPRDYGLKELNANLAVRPPSLSYRLSGGTTSTDEMIATTKRGLLVTRLWGIRGINGQSLLATGLTRDGLWLIENGKITKPVKNFRFTESPVFVLNQVEQLGVPVPVFRPVGKPDTFTEDYYVGVTSAIVPPLKVRDFSFTAMVDAV